MNLKRLTTAIGVIALAFVPLAAARPSLSQTDLNLQLQQALCAQNWGGALKILSQMKRAAGPEYRAQITMYQGRIEALARENVRLSQVMDACNKPTAPAPASTNNPSTPSNNIPPTPSNNTPSVPSNSIPSLPGSNSPSAPGSDMLPPPPPSGIPTLPSNPPPFSF